MRQAKIIYHICNEFYKTEKIEIKDLEELEKYVFARAGELATFCEIPIEKISINVTIPISKK